MARPPQDAIETFMSITGVSEAVALQKLEEHGGDLNGAVNAHFNEGDRINTQQVSIPAPRDDFMHIDDPSDDEVLRPTFPPLSPNLNPFSLLDSTFSRNFFDVGGATGIPSLAPRVSHPKEVREIPIEVKDGNTQPGSSGLGPSIEDVTGNVPAHDPDVHVTVIIDDDDDNENLPTAPANHHNTATGGPLGRHHKPSVSPLVDVTDYNNDIEEEMIQAAIEASKREVEGHPSQQFDVPNDSTGPELDQKSPALEDAELARAVSLSLKTAEQERAFHGRGMHSGEKQSSNSAVMEVDDVDRDTTAKGRQGFGSVKTGSSSQLKSEEGNISVQEETEDVEEQPLVRHRSRRTSSGNAELAESGGLAYSPPSSPQQNNIGSGPPYNGDAFRSDEWGGISSEEHDEAVMLEAAMFGGIPEGASYHFAYPSHQVMQTGSDQSSSLYPRVPRPPSPTLMAQRMLREQQDDEYLASLQADREKELKAQQEAELRRLEEAAAREAALEKQKQEEEENHRKQLEEEECERKLVAKEASLPQEPSPDDENAVTLLVRMPDGSRRGRRFLKSDKLQFLLDYIDIGRVVKPGTYRLVPAKLSRHSPGTSIKDCLINLTTLFLPT
ncbi:plant UBX domain-containing protein 8 isoform X2 [Elaeis guineensis]|uniref:Plant UBX domain-containing protein 8 isoform X2 n=1 Tax=Elaeis guineensis var. tenera TaxID=51953 RepID=A0A6I9RYU2_ELAGV|nr:plant UBX domain-containing protein 8 isoform X2 [Elaeis guineensis]